MLTIFYYKRKGAKRDKDRVLDVLRCRLEDIQSEIEWYTEKKKKFEKMIKQVEEGTLSVDEVSL